MAIRGLQSVQTAPWIGNAPLPAVFTPMYLPHCEVVWGLCHPRDHDHHPLPPRPWSIWMSESAYIAKAKIGFRCHWYIVLHWWLGSPCGTFSFELLESTCQISWTLGIHKEWKKDAQSQRWCTIVGSVERLKNTREGCRTPFRKTSLVLFYQFVQ